MSFPCREGHLSDEPDYCSVCGTSLTRVGGAPPPPPFDPGRGGLDGDCPACGEPREDLDARFCEVCRYDFVEQRLGPPPIAHVPRRATPSPVVPDPNTPSTHAWELVIGVDPSLDVDPDPDHPCPEGVPERVFAVDRDEMLVGRHDELRDIRPELALRDPGVSRRHAKFVRDPAGDVVLQDLASTNGTQVNGADVPAGARRRLRDGDVVTLGRWTRIALRGRR